MALQLPPDLVGLTGPSDRLEVDSQQLRNFLQNLLNEVSDMQTRIQQLEETE